MFFVKFQPIFFSHPCLRPAVAFANLTHPEIPASGRDFGRHKWLHIVSLKPSI